MIYLDYNATAPLRKKVKDRLEKAGEKYFANPNSSHRLGQEVRALIESARFAMAESFGALPGELIFASTATEANLMGLWGLWFSRSKTKEGRKKILATRIEHSSVHENLLFLESQFGAEIVWVPLLSNGTIDLAALKDLLKDEKAGTTSFAFATLMAAHNETGVLQPWEDFAKACDAAGIPVHCDLVQCVARLPFSLKEVKLSTATLAFHKAGGPKGLSILYVKTGVQVEPVIRGGSQEKKRRAGTENICSILAAEALVEEKTELEKIFQTKVKALRDQFEKELLEKFPSCRIVGRESPRLPNTSYVLIPQIKSDVFLMNLDLQGVCASSGSACASGLVLPSRALLALGYSEEEAKCAIRFSLGADTTSEQIFRTLKIIEKIMQRVSPSAQKSVAASLQVEASA